MAGPKAVPGVPETRRYNSTSSRTHGCPPFYFSNQV